MEDDLLSRVLIVPSPSHLTGRNHSALIDSLCQQNATVLLMKFGDESYFVEEQLLPPNAHIIQYDYESLDEALLALRTHLSAHGINLISREQSRIPFVLTGSVLSVPSNIEISFFVSPQSVPDSSKVSVATTSDWDIL